MAILPYCVALSIRARSRGWRTLRQATCAVALPLAVAACGSSAQKHTDTNTATTTSVTAPALTSTEATTPQSLDLAGDWKLILNAGFTGQSLDTSIWRIGWFGNGITSTPGGHAHSCASPANVTLPGDGTVHLTVTQTPSTCSGHTEPYTGAIISTNPHDGRSSGGFEYTYGLLVAKVYVPGNQGSIANWPALWTNGQQWPQDGENDILEGLFGEVCFRFHTRTNQIIGAGSCDPEITPGWHIFASDWEPTRVTYYCDGKLIGTVTGGITGAPQYVVVDNAVSTRNQGIPSTLKVAYVRVWQRQ